MQKIIALFMLLILSGCAAQTIYVPNGQAVRLKQPVRAKVWVKTDTGEQAGKMTIPAGWYCLPDPGE